MADFKAQLDALDPRLWVIFWAVIVGGINYLLKVTGVWSRLPSPLKVPLTAVNGALLTVAFDASFSGDVSVARLVVDAIVGGFSGLTATGGHQFLARLPSPKTKTQPEVAAAKDSTS